jgi:hypothetical protein
MRPLRLWLAALCALLALPLALLAPPTAPAQAQTSAGERCFEATGHCIRGAIRDYWERNGGLAVFGYPITPQRLETVEGGWTGPVQWFERDRLEDHGIHGILAGRLGAVHLEQQGYNIWNPENRSTARPGCEYFPETAHNLCEPFLSYWRQNGGMERFGHPLTEAYPTGSESWQGLVQYFERRRMEYHTERDPAAILLGHLGREALEQGAANACATPVADDLADAFNRVRFRTELGCPGEVFTNVTAAEQPFERGRMLWLNLGDAGTWVHSLSNMPVLDHAQYPDTWTADMPATPVALPAEPPPGLFVPQGALGKVWSEQSDLPTQLGWATAPAQMQPATVQRFGTGWLVWMQGSNTFYAFGPQASDLVFFERPALTIPAPGALPLLAGEPAPRLGGELIVRTQSVDFYRLPGGLTASEIYALSSAVEESIASGSTLMGTNLRGRVSVRFEPAQRGICAIRGLTLSNERTIRMFYGPGSNRANIEVILAHEFIHQLQHDYYGVPEHLNSDIILLEGMAMWGSHPYMLDETEQARYHTRVQEAYEAGALLPLTTDLSADCRTTTRNNIYNQWASFTEYLLLTYGREQFDAVYRNSTGRPPGSAAYQAIYGKTLSKLEAEWLAWVAAERR